MNGSANYNALMEEVCVVRGWCGGIVDGKPTHVDYFIPEAGSVSSAQFAAWVFEADGVDPKVDPDKWQSHRHGLREAFVRHMGADVVDASSLKWKLD